SLAWLRGIREHEKHRPLWAVIGDGSLGYQVSLFEYLVDNDINCVVCVFNNSAWDSIRLEQTFVFRQRYPGTAREPRDYAAIASMNGCETIRVTSAVELDAALESARDWQEKRPLLLDIQTPADTIPLAGLTFALAELDYILTANILQAAISTLKAVWTGKLPLRLLWLAVRAYVL
ncbi:MAG: thiamine pyrophosphate-dependent enzyme, partial [Rhodospirillaceae bacterium]